MTNWAKCFSNHADTQIITMKNAFFYLRYDQQHLEYGLSEMLSLMKGHVGFLGANIANHSLSFFGF